MLFVIHVICSGTKDEMDNLEETTVSLLRLQHPCFALLPTSAPRKLKTQYEALASEQSIIAQGQEAELCESSTGSNSPSKSFASEYYFASSRTRLRAVVLFSSNHARAQSDRKIMQIRKVDEEGLGRGKKCFSSRDSRLWRSLDPSRALQNLREDRDCSQSILEPFNLLGLSLAQKDSIYADIKTPDFWR